MTKEKVYTIKTLAEAKGHSAEYIRRAIREGKLKSAQEQLFKKTWRHVITEAQYTEWRASTANRSQRVDGRNKFTSYMNKAEFVTVLNLLKKNGLDEVATLIARTNVKS